ncbi:MAG: hypothetical protein NZ851_01025 [Aquificaceae bacterium]|nr:hypothetical protein [Aquificaceae bacterium]
MLYLWGVSSSALKIGELLELGRVTYNISTLELSWEPIKLLPFRGSLRLKGVSFGQ